MTIGPLRIAFVSDDEYLPRCATTIRSVLDHHDPEGVELHLLHDGSIGDEAVTRLRAMVGAARLDVHAVDPETVAHLPRIDRFGSIVWLRFLLPELLADIDRLLYLDADTLVTDDLTSMFSTDLEGTPIAAVENVVPREEWSRVRRLRLLDPAEMFNSGVLLMDLDVMRREQLTAQVVDTVTAFSGELRWPDQDVLNIIYAGRWRRLHPRFNTQISLFEWTELADELFGPAIRRAAIEGPAIVHFEGPFTCKPWHRLSIHPWRDRYRETWHRTPWPDAPLTDDVVTTRTIACLPERLQLPAYRMLVNAREDLRGVPRRVWRSLRHRVRRPGEESDVTTRDGTDVHQSRMAPHPLSTVDEETRAVVARCQPWTMSSVERLLATIDATSHIVEARRTGAFVECGVWRGGSVLAMVLTLLRHGVSDRDVYLFDTFTGATAPRGNDTSQFLHPAVHEWSRAEQIRRLLSTSGYPPDRIHLVEEPVELTVPSQAPDTIALLRLGTDRYESTRHELEHLYPRIVSGGTLLIGDYRHRGGARKAVDEYFAGHEELFLARSDYTGSVAVKP